VSDKSARGRVVFFAGQIDGVAERNSPAVGWLVRKSVTDAGFTVSPTLEETSAGQAWNRSLFNSISGADIVVVDLSAPSAFAMFEVGVATGLSKPVLLLGTAESQIPSDLASRRMVHLDVGIDALQTTLVDALNRLVSASDPVTASLLDIETTMHFATGRPPEKEQHIVVNIYQGPVFQGPVAVSDSATFSGRDGVSTTTIVQQRNRQELVGAVKALGLPDEEIEAMTAALDQDEVDGTDPFEPGPHFQRWWTRASIGTASVAGKVAIGASGGLIAKVIAAYFGMH
jgi:hypothetical protein